MYDRQQEIQKALQDGRIRKQRGRIFKAMWRLSPEQRDSIMFDVDRINNFPTGDTPLEELTELADRLDAGWKPQVDTRTTELISAELAARLGTFRDQSGR